MITAKEVLEAIKNKTWTLLDYTDVSTGNIVQAKLI